MKSENKSPILVFFHCNSNTGYAIGRHEYTFSQAALNLAGSYDRVHFAYPSLEEGRSESVPTEIENIIRFDPTSEDAEHLRFIEEYIIDNNIRVALGFDQPVHRKAYRNMRRAGVEWFVSYWGAPMSQLNSGAILLLKRLDVLRRLHRPNLFIFQSEGMRRTGYQGRGIPKSQTRLVHTGIDTDQFSPDIKDRSYAHKLFDIPKDRKIIYYSGHINSRKGVDTLLRAFCELINQTGRSDVHLLLVGNKFGEEGAFNAIFHETDAEQYITFGGYRDDLPKIIPCCYFGVLATNDWDSFPVSTIEIASCGLPLIVSNLLGVNETAIDGETGLHFDPGNHADLTLKMALLLDRPDERDRMGMNARNRVIQNHQRRQQIESLTQCLAMSIRDRADEN